MSLKKPSIKSGEPGSFLREFDRLLKEKISSRQNEFVNLHGWKKLLRRVQIELWAWMKVLKEKSVKRHTIE